MVEEIWMLVLVIVLKVSFWIERSGKMEDLSLLRHKPETRANLSSMTSNGDKPMVISCGYTKTSSMYRDTECM